MNESEYVFAIRPSELIKLRDLVTKVFSKIGTAKSRQRLVYDMLNALKTEDRKRFVWLVLKNLNALRSEESGEVEELSKLLSDLYLKCETPENFEKFAYSIVTGVMSIRGGEENE